MSKLYKTLGVTIVVLFYACTPKIKNIPTDYNVEIFVRVNDKLCIECDVLFLNVKKTTDTQGRVKYRVPPKYIGDITDIIVSSNKIEGSFFNAKSEIEPIISINQAVNIKNDLEEKELIKADLSYLSDEITKVKNRITKFKKEYPNKNFDAFNGPIAQMFDDMDSLNTIIYDIEQNFDLINFEPSIHEINAITSQRRLLHKLKKNVKRFQDKVRILDQIEKENEEVNKNSFNFDTNIFFSTGEYEINNLSRNQKVSILKFVNEVKLIDEKVKQIAYNDPNELTTCMLNIRGYTDGMRFTKDTCHYLLNYKCSGMGENSLDPCNYCLSYLRASSLSTVLYEEIDFFKTEINLNIKGEGSILANGSTEENKDFRKCEASFIISLKSLDVSIFDNITQVSPNSN